MSNTDRINPRPFEEVHEFQGTITRNDYELSDRHFEIMYSTRKPGIIRGRIKGEESREELEHLRKLMIQPSKYAKLRSKITTPNGPIYESDKVFLWSVGGRGWPTEYGNRMVGDVAEFDVEELTFTYFVPIQDTDERRISFALSGPRDFWPPSIRMPDSTGKVKVKHKPLNIEIDNSARAKIQAQPNYVFSSISIDDGHELSISDYHYSIIVKTDVSPTKISDDKFQSQATEIVDDLLLVSSVVSRSWIDWFLSCFQASNKFVSRVRSLRRNYVDEIGYNGDYDHLYERNRFLTEGFLAVAVQALRKHREDGFDLYIPLINLMAANTNEPLEQKFMFYFMALEKLKDMYANKVGLHQSIEKSTERKTFIHGVKSYIDERLANHPARTIVREKVNELNRPPLWYVLERLLMKYGIEWKDLYPPNTDKPTFMRARNKLLHSAEPVDYEILYYEKERLRIVLERLIIKLLGCQETNWAASNTYVKYLSIRPVFK